MVARNEDAAEQAHEKAQRAVRMITHVDGLHQAWEAYWQAWEQVRIATETIRQAQQALLGDVQ